MDEFSFGVLADYLTLEELLYTLEHEGLDVQERTIRFWIAKGVLEKPNRKPSKFADGRKRYFPTKVVGEIHDILRLQKEGWKLTQIKKRLRTPLRAKQAEMPEAEELAKRYLADYLSNGEFRDRLKMIESAEPSTPEWRKVRNFLVARLTHLVGRKQAVKSVTSFMVGLSKRDVAKLLRRSSVRGDSTTGSSEEGKSTPWSQERLQVLRQGLKRLRPPCWPLADLEPTLSRRLEKALEELQEALPKPNEESVPKAKAEELDRCLSQVRQLHQELKASLAFLCDSTY